MFDYSHLRTVQAQRGLHTATIQLEGRKLQPRLLITVDTELFSKSPKSQGLWGRVGGEEWGLVRLLAVFAELEVKATFFLDAYAGNEGDLAEQRRAAELVCARGQDLQLHTHPGQSFDRTRQRLRDYSLPEQEEIVEFGCRRIEQWTGKRPFLHRAGDWGADERTLEVLRRRGFRADFSASPWSQNCGFDPKWIAGNGWTRQEGMLCGVGTCYRDRLTGRTRRVDLGGTSFRETEEMLSRGIDPLILTLHSFSLLRYNRARTRFAPHPEYVERLRAFCGLARTQWGYQIISAREAVAEIQECPDAALPWSNLPTSSVGSSCAGLLKSVRARLSG